MTLGGQKREAEGGKKWVTTEQMRCVGMWNGLLARHQEIVLEKPVLQLSSRNQPGRLIWELLY
jgi:hypothetical protein